MAISQAQVEAMDDKEAGAYAKFGPTGATDQGYRYSCLKVFYRYTHNNYLISIDHVY